MAIKSEKPTPARADVEALKHLMEWCRAEGYWFDTVTVGSVQVTNARDYDPGTRARVNAAIAAQGGDAGERSIYDDVGAGLPGYDGIVGGATS